MNNDNDTITFTHEEIAFVSWVSAVTAQNTALIDEAEFGRVAKTVLQKMGRLVQA